MSKVLFYMPQNFQKENAFGAATLGLAGMPNCPADAVCSFPLQPKGVVLNGTYEEILTAIPGNGLPSSDCFVWQCGG